MEELYNLEGTVIMDGNGDEIMVRYNKELCGGDISEVAKIQIHKNQNNVAKKNIGKKINFYILSCPNLQNEGKYEDFAILEDPETSNRIADAMKALKGKKSFFGSLNEHAIEIIKNHDSSSINKNTDSKNEISHYVNEQIKMGNIKPQDGKWLESVCIHWYKKGNVNK